MKAGKITMDDFNNAMIKLNETGLGDFPSFAGQLIIFPVAVDCIPMCYLHVPLKQTSARFSHFLVFSMESR